jgi:hypothetical protein
MIRDDDVIWVGEQCDALAGDERLAFPDRTGTERGEVQTADPESKNAPRGYPGALMLLGVA